MAPGIPNTPRWVGFVQLHHEARVFEGCSILIHTCHACVAMAALLAWPGGCAAPAARRAWRPPAVPVFLFTVRGYAGPCSALLVQCLIMLGHRAFVECARH